MKRRSLIRVAAAGTLAAGILAAPRRAVARGKRFRWRMALAAPKTLPIWGPGMERFAKNVETLSAGDLSIRVYGGGELIPALGTFDAVKSGEIQMGHAASYYWQGKIPAAPFFCTVPFGMTSDGMISWLIDGGGQQLWDELMLPHGVRCLPCGRTGSQMTGWFNKKINSLEDFKGLKIRCPGLASKIYADAGASPVLLPGGELFTGISTGVIDAVEWVGPYHDYILGLHKAAKYYYRGGWHEPGPVLELMINKNAWDELPSELRDIVSLCAAETDHWMYAVWESKNAEYLEKLRAEGKIEILSFPDEVLAAFKKSADAQKKEIGATSPLAQKIFDSYSSFQRRYMDNLDTSARHLYAELGKP